MNKSSHVLIGRILCTHLKDQYGIVLDTESFLFGCVLPDISCKFLIKPHLLKNYQKQTLKRIQRLLEIRQGSVFFGKKYSRRLGIICHYYADFFCYPHNSKYTGDIISHVNYEKMLYQVLKNGSYIKKQRDHVRHPSGEVDADMIFGYFKEQHDYYERCKPSYDTDITQCILACTEALVLITSTSIIETVNELQLCYPA